MEKSNWVCLGNTFINLDWIVQVFVDDEGAAGGPTLTIIDCHSRVTEWSGIAAVDLLKVMDELAYRGGNEDETES